MFYSLLFSSLGRTIECVLFPLFYGENYIFTPKYKPEYYESKGVFILSYIDHIRLRPSSYPDPVNSDPYNRDPYDRELYGRGSSCRDPQRHVHEVQGSVEIAEREEDPHNHRFATVSGQAIPIGNGDHVHLVRFRTDFYENHFHQFVGKTGGMIKVGDRHVHFLESVTSENDGHRHQFRVATLIDNPIEEEEK